MVGVILKYSREVCRPEEGRWKIKGRKDLHKAWLCCKMQGSISRSHLYFYFAFQTHFDILKVKHLFSASPSSAASSLKSDLDSFSL